MNATPESVIVPVLFQKPPPSLAAVLPETVPPVTVAEPVAEMWNAPPLPGREPASLSAKSVSVRSVVLAPVASMAPPARLAELSENEEPETVSVPPLLRTAPPEPEVPLAELSENVQSVSVPVVPALR